MSTSNKVIIKHGEILFKNHDYIYTSITADENSNLLLNDSLVVNDNVTVGGTLDVLNASTFANVVHITRRDNVSCEKKGAFIVDGGATIKKNLHVHKNIIVDGETLIKGILNITDVTQSLNSGTGAVVIDGGAGIQKNLNVGENLNVIGDSVLSGSLKVLGILDIDYSKINFNYDKVTSNNGNNLLILNYNLHKDSTGLLLTRHNKDVCLDNPFSTGFFESSDKNNVIVNDISFSLDNNYCINWLIKITSGISIDNVRRIKSYNQITKVVTFDYDLDQPVDINDQFALYNNIYNGMVYDNDKKEFLFTCTYNYNQSIVNDGKNNMLNIHGQNALFDGIISASMVTTLSDSRLKTNIKNVSTDEIVNIINKLNIVEYNWNTTMYPHCNTHKQIGLIAQDIEKVLPSIVQIDNRGYKSLAYDKLVPILIEYTKLLQNRIEILEKHIVNNNTTL